MQELSTFPSTQGITEPLSPFTPSTRIGGRKRTIAVVILWAVVALTLVTVAVAIPARLQELRSPPPEVLQVLARVGVTVEVYATSFLAMEVGIVLAFAAIASIIFWQRSDDWVAVFMSGALVTYAAYVTPTMDAIFNNGSAWWISGRIVECIGITSAITFFYVFPNGRFTPSITRWLALLCIASGVGPAFIPVAGYNPFDPFTLPFGWYIVLLGWFLTGLFAQIYRYRYASNALQQQQMKWVVFSTGIAVLAYAAVATPRHLLILMGRPPETLIIYELFAVRVFLLVVIPIPLAFAVSILRYRLWEIDSLINRTIVYASLTAILAGLYTASIGLSQRLMVTITGANSDGPIVFTTLVVAAAFTPIKTGLQRLVDKYLKQAGDPVAILGAYRKQVTAILQVIDPERLLPAIFDQTVRAFGATSGVLYRDRNDQRSVMFATRGWTGQAAVSIPIAPNGHRFGCLELGPRRSGQGYSVEDHQTIEQVFNQVVGSVIVFGREPDDVSIADTETDQ